MSDPEEFKALAAELSRLQESGKSQVAILMERAEAAGFDPAGLRRFVSWKRKDGEKRAQQEAVDQQCQYLAGERETPATLPVGCELAQALNLYRRQMTVRQVAEELRISTGKAGKLRQLARMFVADVHVHATVDNVDDVPEHDPETGEISEQKPEPVAAPSVPAAKVWRAITAAREEHDARKEAERAFARERRRAAQAAFDKRNAEIDADPLTLPPFVDRRYRLPA